MVWRLYRLIAERVWHQVNNHGELERKGLFCSYELFVESAQQVTLQLIAEARQVAFQTSELFFCKREFSTMRDPNPPIVYMHGYCTKTRYVGLNVREAFLGSLPTLFPPWTVKAHTGHSNPCAAGIRQHSACFLLIAHGCGGSSEPLYRLYQSWMGRHLSHTPAHEAAGCIRELLHILWRVDVFFSLFHHLLIWKPGKKLYWDFSGRRIHVFEKPIKYITM